VAGLLFFAVGLDREVLRLFARSLESIPPGGYPLELLSAESVIHLGASLFSVGLRLALPVVALLVMVDIALALLSRVNAQLQLLTLAFPAKMLIALLVLTWIAFLFPRMGREIGGLAVATAHRALRL
jgi:flagellar biosynthetic protein FliR